LIVMIAGGGILAVGAFMHRYLPRTPLLSRVFLQPPEGEAREEQAIRERLADYEHLLGARGTTSTQLTPSGKAIFGDETVDVMADGEVIERGTEVVIVEVRGNRVLVKAVSA
jgi:membrane protein implicated in regulation of membrane protease activity